MDRLTLEESREAELELTERQATALAAIGRKLASSKLWWGDEDEPDREEGVPRSVIVCKKSETPGRWRVTVVNAIGVVAVGDVVLVVRPKIPIRHALFLVQKSGHLPRLGAEHALAAAGEELWPLVATWFVAATEVVLRRDLVLDYQEVEEEIPVIRGRVEPVSAVRAVYSARPEFLCEYENFTADTPLNRILKAAARHVAGSSALEWAIRRRAARLADRMDDVGEVRTADLWAQPDRRTGHYADALALARHVLLARGRVVEHGDAVTFTFLIPTPAMIEEGIRLVLRDGLAVDVRKSRVSAVGADLTFNPDLVFARGLAIGDVKYRLSAALRRSDVNQVVTFATAFRSSNSAVVGFWPPGATNQPPFSVGDVSVRHFGWIADPSVEAEVAAERLVSDVREWSGRLRPN